MTLEASTGEAGLSMGGQALVTRRLCQDSEAGRTVTGAIGPQSVGPKARLVLDALGGGRRPLARSNRRRCAEERSADA